MFISMLLFSCSSSEVSIPSGILSRDQMVAVLTDVQVAEAAILYQNSRGNISESKAPEYYQYIFQKHHITEKQFRESFSFYVSQVELMDKIYEDVINEISKKQAEITAK